MHAHKFLNARHGDAGASIITSGGFSRPACDLFVNKALAESRLLAFGTSACAPRPVPHEAAGAIRELTSD